MRGRGEASGAEGPRLGVASWPVDKQSLYAAGIFLSAALGGWCTFMSFRVRRQEETVRRQEEKVRAQEEKQRGEATQLRLEQIAAGQGDKGAAARYIAAQAELAQTFAKEMVPQAFDKFTASREHRRSLTKSVEDETERLRNKVRLRAEPLRSFVVEYIDGWIRRAQKEGLQCEVKRDESAPVVGDANRSSVSYEVDFKTGAHLLIFSYAAEIKAGQIFSGYGIGVRYRPANSRDDTQECGIGANGEAGQYVLARGVKRPEYTFDVADSGDNSPAKEEAYNAAVREALNQVMGRLITENSDL
jgi:hypothetical protein